MSTYSASGVNLDAAYSFIQGVSRIAKKTYNSSVIGGIGGFAGLYKLPSGYQNPVLVACTDGVGTKLKLAYENNYLENIGQDLVAMCVNDLLCAGAKPLFFLDYLATESLEPEEALVIAESIGKACEYADCVLLGGETAELPGMLPEHGYELAGFTVGIVEEANILNSQNTTEGDLLIALPSSGVHSNGYSLVRSIISDADLDLQKTYEGFQNPLIEELLVPTIIYTKLLQPIMSRVKTVAHITGGGLPENLPRAYTDNLQAVIDTAAWEPPQIFKFLQSAGSVDTQEMFKVFNMGIGLVLIISPSERDTICHYLNEQKQIFYEIGRLSLKASESSPSLVFGV